MRLGEELYALGRVDEAAQEIFAALEIDPALAEAHVDLGRIKQRWGDAPAAEAS